MNDNLFNLCELETERVQGDGKASLRTLRDWAAVDLLFTPVELPQMACRRSRCECRAREMVSGNQHAGKC